MGKIHIVALLISVLLVSLSMEINVCVDQDFRWTEVKRMEPYELFSDALSIFIELLLNVCTTVIKLCIIPVCIITTCIDLFIEIIILYVKQFSSELLQMLVQELQDLFTLAKAIFIMMQQMISGHTAAYASIPDISYFVFLLVCKCPDNFLFSFCGNQNISG